MIPVTINAVNFGNGNHCLNCKAELGLYKQGENLYEVCQRNENLRDLYRVHKRYICATSVPKRYLTEEEFATLTSYREEKEDEAYKMLLGKAIEANIRVDYYRGDFIREHNGVFSVKNDKGISEETAKSFDLKEVVEYDYEKRYANGYYNIVTFGNNRNWELRAHYEPSTQERITEGKAEEWIKNN